MESYLNSDSQYARKDTQKVIGATCNSKLAWRHLGDPGFDGQTSGKIEAY